MVSLQELLGDKRSRGAFGEVQLEALVRNVLPPGGLRVPVHAVQRHPRRLRAEAAGADRPGRGGLQVPAGELPPHVRLGTATSGDRAQAQRQFRADIKKHVDDIASKYIIPDETSDGAVMFVPAEAVFAEIHAHHAEVVDYAIGSACGSCRRPR